MVAVNSGKPELCSKQGIGKQKSRNTAVLWLSPSNVIITQKLNENKTVYIGKCVINYQDNIYREFLLL